MRPSANRRNYAYLYLLAGIISLVSSATSPTGALAAFLTESARSHYDQAHNLARAGDHNKAIDQYLAAYKLDPDSLVGRYSYSALRSYGLSEKLLAGPRTASTVYRQTEELKARTGANARDQISSRAQFDSARLRKIEQEKADDIDQVIANPTLKTVYNPYYSNGFGYNRYRYPNTGGFIRTVDPVATQARIDQVKARAEAKKQRELELAKAKADELERVADHKSSLVEESARNLESQMSGRGVTLQAHGTNLYVRSYR